MQEGRLPVYYFTFYIMLINIMNLIWLVLWINYVGAYIVYDEGDKRTYSDSLDYCKSRNGTLLRYGELFNKVIRTCKSNGTNIQVWTGKPFYLPFFRCTNISATALRTPTINRTNDKHIAVCADFCNDVIFSAFSVQTDECGCYEQVPNLTNKCQIENCPGNEYDSCGSGTSIFLLYSKDYIASNNLKCVYRNFQNSSSNGQEFSSLFSSSANCISNNSYICQVGDSDEIICKPNNQLTPKASTTSTTGPNSPTSIEKLTAGDITKSPNLQCSTRDMQEIKAEPIDISPNLGLIIGLTASAVFNVILLALVCWKVALRRPSNYTTYRAPNEAHSLHEYDTVMVQPGREQRDYVNTSDNMYSKDNHTYCDLHHSTLPEQANSKE